MLLDFLPSLPPIAQRGLWASLVILLYLALCAWIGWRVRTQRQQLMHAAAALLPPSLPPQHPTLPILVVHASQTGHAEQLAWQTAQTLRQGGAAVQVLSLAQLDGAWLQDAKHTRHLLFLVSTYGEGDPPDAAAPFVRRYLAAPPSCTRLDLSHLHYGLLALGDRQYRHFCGFGRQLDAWLQHQGARTLFPRIELDNANAATLQQWQQAIRQLPSQLGLPVLAESADAHTPACAGSADLAAFSSPSVFSDWQLLERRLLNPGSLGAPTFHLELAPIQSPLPDWEAGDLAQIQAPGDPERPRDYSIASLPSDGRLHLLVRQERHADGSLGLASGWLTVQAEVGALIALRLRPHPNFRLGNNAHRPLILIGNGTGMAGLRAHLKAQARDNRRGHWLIFGERQSTRDFYYREDVLAWHETGVLERLDLAFSRDQAERLYVQQRLREARAVLQAWIEAGAALYVCGSLAGMAAGVHDALLDIVGVDGVDELQRQGRYRRDVY